MFLTYSLRHKQRTVHLTRLAHMFSARVISDALAIFDGKAYILPVTCRVSAVGLFLESCSFNSSFLISTPEKTGSDERIDAAEETDLQDASRNQSCVKVQ